MYPHLLSSQFPSDSWHIFDLQNTEDESLKRESQKMKMCLLCKGSNNATLRRSCCRMEHLTISIQDARFEPFLNQP